MSSPIGRFVAAIADKVPAGVSEPLHRELEAHKLVEGGGIDEARACLSTACTALDTAVGGTRTHRVDTGDEAHRESEWLQGIRNKVDRQRRDAADALGEALDVAVERLGPFPGGRLASFKHPDEAPAVVPTVEPTSDELVEMAAGSGHAVGALSAAGHVDALEVVKLTLADLKARNRFEPS